MSIKLNNVELKNEQTNFKQKEAFSQNGKKSYLNAPNLILGSLASVGVLGAADILLCKGKYINKLTGKAKELENAIARATEAETRATNAESRLTANETKMAEIEKEFNSFIEYLKKYQTGDNGRTENIFSSNFDKKELLAKIKALNEGEGALLKNLFIHQKWSQRLHEGPKKAILVWIQRVYSEYAGEKEFTKELKKLMRQLNYEFVEYSEETKQLYKELLKESNKDLSEKKLNEIWEDSFFKEVFERIDANVNEIVTSKYAIRDKLSGKIVLPGVVVFPKG